MNARRRFDDSRLVRVVVIVRIRLSFVCVHVEVHFGRCSLIIRCRLDWHDGLVAVNRTDAFVNGLNGILASTERETADGIVVGLTISTQLCSVRMLMHSLTSSSPVQSCRTKESVERMLEGLGFTWKSAKIWSRESSIIFENEI